MQQAIEMAVRRRLTKKGMLALLSFPETEKYLTEFIRDEFRRICSEQVVE